MKSLDTDLDCQLHQLEMEWREVYESSIQARSTYRALAARGAGANVLDAAKGRMERADALKERVTARIDRLEAKSET